MPFVDYERRETLLWWKRGWCTPLSGSDSLVACVGMAWIRGGHLLSHLCFPQEALKRQQHHLVAHLFLPSSGVKMDRLWCVECLVERIGHYIPVSYRVLWECEEPKSTATCRERGNCFSWRERRPYCHIELESYEMSSWPSVVVLPIKVEKLYLSGYQVPWTHSQYR